MKSAFCICRKSPLVFADSLRMCRLSASLRSQFCVAYLDTLKRLHNRAAVFMCEYAGCDHSGKYCPSSASYNALASAEQ